MLSLIILSVIIFLVVFFLRIRYPTVIFFSILILASQLSLILRIAWVFASSRGGWDIMENIIWGILLIAVNVMGILLSIISFVIKRKIVGYVMLLVTLTLSTPFLSMPFDESPLISSIMRCFTPFVAAQRNEITEVPKKLGLGWRIILH